MRLLRRLLAYAKIGGKARRNRADAVKYLARRPAIMAAVGVYEAAVMLSNSVDPRAKYLAQLQVATRVGCPF